MTSESMDRLNPIREEIDRIDEEILQQLNDRAREVLRIVEIKKELGMPVYFPEREDEILRLVQGSNKGPLSDEAIRRVFERIIDESRRLERTLGEEVDAEREGPDSEDGSPDIVVD